jgi:hypothetical protein
MDQYVSWNLSALVRRRLLPGYRAKKEQGNGPAKKLFVVTDPRLNTYDLRLSAWRRRCVRR